MPQTAALADTVPMSLLDSDKMPSFVPRKETRVR